MIFLEYPSLDFQVTRPPEAPSYIYRASILEDGNVVASSDFELRQDLKLFQMLKSIEEKVTKSPKEPENQKEKTETREENEREEPHIEFGKMLYSRVFFGELGEYFNKSIKEFRKMMADSGFHSGLMKMFRKLRRCPGNTCTTMKIF